jgi:hypothetical protein
MENRAKSKCAHIPCSCEVVPGQKYCSEPCQDAGSDEVEIACQCEHTACLVTL